MKNVYRTLEKVFDELNATLQKAKRENRDYISAIYENGIIIFDVWQHLKGKNWNNLTDRERLEAVSYAVPDFILRDRIYTCPQFLHVYMQNASFTKEEFARKKRKIQELKKRKEIAKVEVEETFEDRDYDFMDMITSWAWKERYTNVKPGERAIDRVCITADDGSYVAINLLKTKSPKKNKFLAYVFSSIKDLCKCENIALEVSKILDSEQ